MSSFIEFTIGRGETFNTVVSITDDSTAGPFNLSGYTANSQLRKSHYASDISATFNCTISNVSTGNIIWTLSNTSSNITPGTYVYDIFLHGANESIRVMEGTFVITPRVTYC